MTLIGLYLAIIWLPQFKRLDLNHFVGMACGLIFIFVFLGSGLFLLHKVVKNAKTVLSITSEGLSYGVKSYRWEDVTEIGIMRKYTNRRDLYCTTRFHPDIVELLVARWLSSGQIASLFESLRSDVVPRHPHVCLSEKDDELG